MHPSTDHRIIIASLNIILNIYLFRVRPRHSLSIRISGTTHIELHVYRNSYLHKFVHTTQCHTRARWHTHTTDRQCAIVCDAQFYCLRVVERLGNTRPRLRRRHPPHSPPLPPYRWQQAREHWMGCSRQQVCALCTTSNTVHNIHGTIYIK